MERALHGIKFYLCSPTPAPFFPRRRRRRFALFKLSLSWSPSFSFPFFSSSCLDISFLTLSARCSTCQTPEDVGFETAEGEEQRKEGGRDRQAESDHRGHLHIYRRHCTSTSVRVPPCTSIVPTWVPFSLCIHLAPSLYTVIASTLCELPVVQLPPFVMKEEKGRRTKAPGSFLCFSKKKKNISLYPQNFPEYVFVIL